jgi:hypothetical protein
VGLVETTILAWSAPVSRRTDSAAGDGATVFRHACKLIAGRRSQDRRVSKKKPQRLRGFWSTNPLGGGGCRVSRSPAS